MTERQTQLEAQVERAREQVQQLRAQRRSLAFREAGIDTSGGIGKAIANVYDGPPSADDIRQFAATEYGYGDNQEQDNE